MFIFTVTMYAIRFIIAFLMTIERELLSIDIISIKCFFLFYTVRHDVIEDKAQCV